jgi:hypothetical protein
MELFLNLLWLLLAVPAVWVWRTARCRHVRSAGQSRQCVLVLGCLLAMLFPVVSASDDLQAMRPEIEESGNRAGPRNSSHGRCSSVPDGVSGNFALSASRTAISPDQSVWLEVLSPSVLRPTAALVLARAGRAPPLSSLG